MSFFERMQTPKRDGGPIGGSSPHRRRPRGALAVVVPGMLLLMSAATPAGAAKAKTELKLATIAPEGSTWMNLMEELDAAIRAETGNSVGLRWYPGGVQGDELIVLRKIRTGQLHGGGFTGVGLGEIDPGTRVLELPFLFRSQAEVDAVHQAMDPVFEERLHAAGFTVLGWADVGFVYLYSKESVATTDDLKRQKVWLWEGDPLAEAFLRAAGVSPVPLPVTDVLTSLQTGLISTVYSTPLGAIALQWFSRVSYTTDLPVTHSIGAVVVTNDAFERIPPEHREAVRRLAREFFGKLREAAVRDNLKSIEVIREAGVATVAPPEAEIGRFVAIGEDVRRELVGKLYDQTLLDQVVGVVREARSGAGSR